MNQLNPNMIIAGPVRLSYLSVFTPRRNDLRNEDEYSVVLLFPKSKHDHVDGPAEAKAVNAAIKAVAAAKFGETVKKYAVPLKDGDTETNGNGDPKHPGYWYLSARSKAEYSITLIDGAKREARADDWTSGDWALVKLSLYAYDFQGRKGVGCGLRGIQFLHKDEPFGGTARADEGFEEVKTAALVGASGEGDDHDPFAGE
jgi:hypothetical protein